MSLEPTRNEDENNGELLPGGKIGPFRLVRKIGEGGMGVVYEAEDTRLRRRVALKILPPSLVGDPSRKRRLLREARSGSAAKHPSIAAVFEVGEADGAVYLAMELAPGETLRARLARRGGALEVGEALNLGVSVARGLAKAHEAGVVHRDLKPENVMVTGDGAIKILDFGLSKMRAPETREELEIAPTITDTVTVEGRVILGTPSYMAPEQAKGRAVDARADIFSLGVMLYEVLTGERPFRGETPIEIIISIDRDEPPAASSVNPRALVEVDRILARCLAKRPEDRFSSAEDLASALEAALRELPAAGAAGLPGSRRSRARVIGVIGVIAIATVGAIGVIALKPKAGGPAAGSSGARPLRHLCERGSEEAAAAAKCRPRETAWCDTAERVIACCGEGRVATGRDGLCECPVGGCDPKAWKAPEPEVIQKVVRAAFGDLRACYAAALQKVPSQGGRVALGLELTPDGDVFRARINSTTFPDTEMQACALRLARSLKFPPPPSGSCTVDYPVIFSPGED
ncbi:MAG TPA: protein kinase [Polyangiaceae bacterium]|nr:protein kinase [Polyangiaceae bacterium]